MCGLGIKVILFFLFFLRKPVLLTTIYDQISFKSRYFSITLGVLFFNFTECGNKRVQIHVRGNLSDYDIEKIQEIKEIVAAVFGCTAEEIHICGYLHSTSFIVVFAVKEIYLRNLLAMKQQDKDKLCSLNIDYLIASALER